MQAELQRILGCRACRGTRSRWRRRASHDRFLRPCVAAHNGAAGGDPRPAVQPRTGRGHAASRTGSSSTSGRMRCTWSSTPAFWRWPAARAGWRDAAAVRGMRAGGGGGRAGAARGMLSARFGVDAAGAEPSPDCLGYTSFLLATAYHEPWEVLLAALLPCFWLYWDVGKAIAREAGADNPYRAWIDTYADEASATPCER